MPRADSPLRERMIFAFGARRSGTWWLQRILTAHPEVAGVPSETYLFELGMRPLLERFHHGLKSSTTVAQMHADRDVVLDAARDFCDRVFLPYLTPDARYLSERSPGHAKAVDVIAPIYPDARLVHIIRDGRDVARSLVAREWGPASVGEAAREWRDSIVDARAAAPPGSYLELRYEELLADLEGGTRRLYEWLGLPAGDAVVAEALAVARRPANEDPKDPRIAAGKWRDHFSDSDLAAFEAEAGELLEELGYERAAPVAAGTGPPPASPAPEPHAGPERSPQPASAPAAAPATRLRGAIAARLPGRARRAATEPAPARQQWEVGGALAGSQTVADSLLEALHGGDRGEAAALFDPDVSLRIVADDGEQAVTGARRAVELLFEDPAWRSPQASGRAHPGVPTFTLVLGYEAGGGVLAWRILCAEIRARHVVSLVLYRLGAPAVSA